MIHDSINKSTIVDCYLYDNNTIYDITDFLIEVRKYKGYKVRSFNSYAHEIKAHKRLYKLGLFRSHTKDADLEVPINKLLDRIYSIIGF